MALVAYGNSDSSDYEDEEFEDTEIPKSTEDLAKSGNQEDEPVVPSSSALNSDTSKLFKILPTPSKGPIIEEDDEFLHKKETAPNIPRPKAKITVPSLSDFKDVEDSSGTNKRRIPSSSKSGLLSLLPQPKQVSSTKSLIPQAVTNRIKQPEKKETKLPNKVNPVPKVNTKLPLDYSDDSDEDIQNDFFSFNKPVEELPVIEELVVESKPVFSEVGSTEQVLPVSVEDYHNGESEVVNEDYNAGYSNSGASEEIALDDEAIRQLCGSRGKRQRDDIQIVDVNQKEVLGDAKEWLLKGLMDDTSKRVSAKKSKGNEPTGQQKRKHQITYLAHQAKANEAELQNQWANNRVTKRKTQSKYGF